MTKKISGMDDLPEEIVLEILLRVCTRPLFRSKCVSKLWNSIISNPKFRNNYLQQARSSPKSLSSRHLSVMLYPHVDTPRNDPNCLSNKARDLTDSVPSVNIIDNDAPPPLYVTAFDIPTPLYAVLASSNGLILSCLSPSQYPTYDEDEYEWEHKFCVSNPLTKQSVKLPMVMLTGFPWAVSLATQLGGENQDYITAYKVVCIQIITRHPHPPISVEHAKIAIYSSDTGRWTLKKQISCPAAVTSRPTGRPISYKGILHCFDWNTRTIVTYDPYNSPYGFGSIKLPSGSGKSVINSGVELVRLGHDELIEFGEIVDCGDRGWRLFVWRLVNYGKGEWCVVKRCVISPLWKESLLSDCKLLVAPYSWKDDVFCLVCANKSVVTVHDLGSSEELFGDPFDVKGKMSYTPYRLVESLVPITLSPWPSPFHGQAGRNSSSEPGFGKIIPAWFPSL